MLCWLSALGVGEGVSEKGVESRGLTGMEQGCMGANGVVNELYSLGDQVGESKRSVEKALEYEGSDEALPTHS